LSSNNQEIIMVDPISSKNTSIMQGPEYKKKLDALE
jgi:hypothetical protein